ncbi:sigma 54-interacting transcriptional regulator [bacterium]|nr:sigma 54-interacting transcriptional regulator [bacterium]
MIKILFICSGGSGRSQIAAAFAKSIAPSNTEIFSAGDIKSDISPYAVDVMKEKGFDLNFKWYHIDEIQNKHFDIVVTLCNQARENCPFLPGAPARIHWPLEDPQKSVDIDKEIQLDNFRLIRDEIEFKVSSLFLHGYIEALMQVKLTFESLLDNLTDGVMAHDLDRNIFFFNRAAQRITGLSYSEVIGKDCHDIFPGRFCGGGCSFCENGRQHVDRLRYPQIFLRGNGERRELEMSVVTLKTVRDDIIGALVIFRDQTEIIHIRKKLEESRGFHGIIGKHISMQKVFDSIYELADINAPILIQGESGTGKEMVALALHELSLREPGPFVPVNCGALPEGTLESELFGHVKGAFTGAIRNKKGRFELAEGGAIFLDEIGEISPAMQVKLLRVIQDKTFMPVGGEKQIEVNVRIICATNKDLRLLTQQGMFREDLFYRLAVIPITLPPLRERKSDIPLLVDYFLDKLSVDTSKNIRVVSDQALDILEKYHWPGNVRELRNSVQYGIIKCRGEMLEAEHLPPEIQGGGNMTANRPGRQRVLNKQTVEEALQKTGGNKAKAARMLKVSRTTLYRFLDDYDV